MKVFLTGASGILGSDIAKQLELLGHIYRGFDSQNIDIGNYKDVQSKVEIFKPDYIIHAAAMTNVDLCEDDRDAAFRINVIGSQNIAQAAASINVPVTYISSCGVYGNDKKTSYTETDVTKPLNFHHTTKLAGERKVMEYSKKYLIIRPGWLFGGTITHKKNFVEARRKEAAQNAIINSASDKIGSPTYTVDLAKQILMLIAGGYTGTFNVVNEGCATRYEYVREIVNLLKLNTIVEPIDSGAFKRKANMPDNECLENANLNLKQVNIMPHWKDSMKEYITKTYKL
jgi:dTDP-4-dehydrorhamnose reductase